MYFLKGLFLASFAMLGMSAVTSIEKKFIQGPENSYLLNSSSIFLPTDYLTMNKPVFDVRTVEIKTGMIGGLDSSVSTGVESRAFKDSLDNDFFYQMWHLAHVDEKHSRINVVTIIVSLGGMEISPSGDIEEYNRALDAISDTKVYIQVYRTWSMPVTIPLSQSNIDGWWHSITHAFHAVMHVYNEVKPWIGIARTVVPILISMSDTQPGLGLKSVNYLPEPLFVEESSTPPSSSSSSSSTNSVFSYAITPGDMAAIVICVFLSGVFTTIVVPRIYNRKTMVSNAYKLNNGKIETNPSTTTPFV